MNIRNQRGCFFIAGLILLVLLITPGVAPRSAVLAGPAPAVTPTGPAVARFSGDAIKTSLPDGTIPQMELRPSRAAYPGCLDAYEEPTLDYYNDNLELTDITIIATCGWKPDETVKVTLMDPLGKFTTSEVKAVPARLKKGVYEADVFYQPGVDAQPGKYRFTLQGSSGTVKAKITYVRPTKARLYLAAEDRFKPAFTAAGSSHRLRLDGFLPNEPVRLLAYRFEGSLMQFVGWQDYVTDRFGQLIIETDVPNTAKGAQAEAKATEMNYFVYARETHFIPLERFTPHAANITRQFDMELYCPGAQAPRLTGPSAIRQAEGLTTLKIHQQPGFGARVVAQAGKDTALRTFGYPKCIDRAFWWQVSLSSSPFFGWTAESYLGKYQVEAAK